jgi:hypothetical protein
MHCALATLVAIAITGALFTRAAACRAAAWLILKALFRIKLLLAGGELEVGAALTAFKVFVFEHGKSSSDFLLNGLGTAWLFDLSPGRQIDRKRD